MKKKTRIFLMLVGIPFVVGFLLGLLIGGSCSRHGGEGPAAQEETATGSGPEEGITSETALPEAEAIEGPEDGFAADDDTDGIGVPEQKEIIYYTRMIPYAKTFADLNETHLEKAREAGLKRIPSGRDDIDKSVLELIEDDDYLVVDRLRYSVPYLTKGAAAELHRIAKAFSDSLESKHFPDYKLVVTSILRTEEDVARLRRSGNPNASDNSAHCYGTTFDITYTRYWREIETDEFMQPYELTKVLAEVLRDEKQAGRILVKYERKEHCFHITNYHE
ncbi:MAG: hypothetical protein IJU27_08355 [Bacteroidales bacterium]|nr:hypothetical protein [Bacteroidales bacterium]